MTPDLRARLEALREWVRSSGKYRQMLTGEVGREVIEHIATLDALLRSPQEAQTPQLCNLRDCETHGKCCWPDDCEANYKDQRASAAQELPAACDKPSASKLQPGADIPALQAADRDGSVSAQQPAQSEAHPPAPALSAGDKELVRKLYHVAYNCAVGERL